MPGTGTMAKTKTPSRTKAKTNAKTGPKANGKTKTLPPRDKAKPADTWDLSSLFKGDAEWETACKKWGGQIPQYGKYKGHLGDSAEMLAACLRFDAGFDRLGERVGVYAYLSGAAAHGNS